MQDVIVVIGSNSFSGAHFVDYMLRQGARVIGMSRSPEPHAIFLPYKVHQNADFQYYQLDLNHDLESMMEIISRLQAGYVVNFAAQSMVAESWQKPEDWFRTNVVANVMLHDRLRSCSFLKRYVHISTPEVYGSCSGLVKESTIYNPSTPYAVSRAAADMSLMSFFRTYRFPVVFTRAANVYGAGQQLYRIIPRTILSFLNGGKLQLHGGGVSVRSFIHIEDVAAGTWKAAQLGEPGEIYHLSTSRSISISSLVQMIAVQMGVVIDEHVEIVGERLGKDSAYLLDSNKARENLGWADQISLENGIEETIAWVRDNLSVINSQPLDYIHKA
jgi:dTDP-glucose 4,6-dehydratase